MSATRISLGKCRRVILCLSMYSMSRKFVATHRDRISMLSPRPEMIAGALITRHTWRRHVLTDARDARRVRGSSNQAAHFAQRGLAAHRNTYSINTYDLASDLGGRGLLRSAASALWNVSQDDEATLCTTTNWNVTTRHFEQPCNATDRESENSLRVSLTRPASGQSGFDGAASALDHIHLTGVGLFGVSKGSRCRTTDVEVVDARAEPRRDCTLADSRRDDLSNQSRAPIWRRTSLPRRKVKAGRPCPIGTLSQLIPLGMSFVTLA